MAERPFAHVTVCLLIQSNDLFKRVYTVQWLATAYMLGAAVMVPVSAFAYRSLPTRPLFCGTVALLVIGIVNRSNVTKYSVNQYFANLEARNA